MKNLIFIFSLFTFFHLHAQKAATLWQAKQSNWVYVSANWNTQENVVFGRCLFMKVTNRLKQEIKIVIPTGETTFLSHNPDYQNQMVVKNETMTIAANASDTISLYTVCIGHAKQSPGRGNAFSLEDQKDLRLVEMARVIADNGYYNTSTAQAAVWSVQGHTPISKVFSRDSIMAWRLTSAVSRLSGQTMPDRIDLRGHHIVVLNGSFSYQVTKPVVATLGVYDSSGKAVNMMIEKKLLPTALHHFKYHANEIADNGSAFWIKLSDEKGTVLYSKAITEKDNSGDMEVFSQRIIFPFTLDKGYKDLSLGVYDTNGSLIAEIFGYRHWPMGTHNINYTLNHNRKNDSVFYVRLITKDKKVVTQKLIRKKGSSDDKYAEETLAIRLKYPVATKVEKAKCVVFSEFGDEVAVLFEDEKLSPGPNDVKYNLKHTYGKKAKFIIQVLSPTGQIVYCKELTQF